MKKADLLRLPKLKITKEIKEVAKSDKGMLKGTSQYKYRIYKYKNYYRAKVFKEILKVEIYTRDRDDILREDPSYLIFISKNDKKFITWDAIEEKWRTAKIDRIDSRWNYYEEKRYYSRGTEKTIIEYLDNGKKRGYESIYQFQADIREEKLKKQHRSITDAIDSKMELVPDLPKGFKKWVENRAMKHSRYIYYVYSRDVKEGYCTHCKEMVQLKEKPKYNKEGRCQKCKSEITYKTEKRAGTVEDEGYASIIQKTREGYVYRYFEIRKNYNNYKKPILETLERIRIFYNNEFQLIAEYEFTEFKSTRIIRWCKRSDYSYYSYYSGVRHNCSTLYTRNLKRILKGTKYQYSAIEIFAKNTQWFMPTTYLHNYERHKFIEYLVKAKLYKIVESYIEYSGNRAINDYGRRIYDVLQIKKEQVKMLSEMNANKEELEVLQAANEKEVVLNKEQLRFMGKAKHYKLIDFMKYRTPHKIIRYITEQNQKGEKIYETAREYYDYLNMQEQLGQDLKNDFIFFPRNLKRAHDIAVEELNYEKQKLQDKQDKKDSVELSKIAKEIEHYKMKDKDFTICIPKSVDDLKKEGNELHHCVLTYADLIIARESTILFVREVKAPDKPFYTLEIIDNKVIQLRGKYNHRATPEVEAFVEKFKKKKLYKHPERQAI